MSLLHMKGSVREQLQICFLCSGRLLCCPCQGPRKALAEGGVLSLPLRQRCPFPSIVHPIRAPYPLPRAIAFCSSECFRGGKAVSYPCIYVVLLGIALLG